MYDVVIIGAGVVGAMLARAFSRYELKVCIVDKENDIAMGATKANSAIVHAGFDAKPGTLKAKLNVLGSKMMCEICKELSVSYRNNGSLVVGYSDEDKQKLSELLSGGIQNGVEGLRIIDGSELKELEPNLSDEVKCALYAPTGAIVCPYELTEAAIGNAMDNGAELKLNFCVTRITKRLGIYTIESSDKQKIQARCVINAAGIYSDKVSEMVNKVSFTVHPRRGEYMLLDRECGNHVNCTIFTVPTKMGKGILVSPTVDNNLLVGPTSVDMEDKEDKKTSAEGVSELKVKANRMVKGIDYRMVITSFCGLRSVGSTGDFIIEMPKKNFVNVAGIESPGLSSAPAIAEYVLDMLRESGMELVPKADYKKTRSTYKHFKDWDMARKNEMIKKDPSFGNIICRCEGISEGEILCAIRTNPKPHDLDGVKRRTRAQMGRCQGGFCSPYITKLLAKEMGVSMEDVTKCGNNSFILSGKLKEDEKNA